MSIRCRLWAIAFLLSAAGCGEKKADWSYTTGWPDDGRWWARGGRGDVGGDGDDGDGDDRGGEKAAPLAELRADVGRVFTDHCAPCHSGREGVEYGGFADIFDADAMVGRGLIVPGEAESSLLYQRIAGGEMPPGALEFDEEGEPVAAPGARDPFDPRRTIGAVPAEGLAAVGEWIRLGAPPLREGG